MAPLQIKTMFLKNIYTIYNFFHNTNFKLEIERGKHNRGRKEGVYNVRIQFFILRLTFSFSYVPAPDYVNIFYTHRIHTKSLLDHVAIFEMTHLLTI